MHVCFYADASELWGAERSLALLCQALLGRGHDVTVITAPNSPLPSTLPIGVSHHEIVLCPSPVARSTGSLATSSVRVQIKQFLGIVKGAIRLWRFLRKVPKIDSLVCFTTWRAGEVLAAARLLRTTAVFDLHDTFTTTAAKKALSLISALYDTVVVPTRHLALTSELNLSDCRVVPRPLGEVPELDGSDVRKWDVVIVGQVVPHKRVATAAEAIARGGEFQVAVVGMPETSLTEYQMHLLLTATNTPNLHVFSQTDDILPFLSQSKAVVSYADHEAFGRTIIEGAGSGCYPIVREGTGAEEIVVSLGIGSIVRDEESLLQAVRIASSFSDRELLSRRVRDEYGLSRIGELYVGALT